MKWYNDLAVVKYVDLCKLNVTVREGGGGYDVYLAPKSTGRKART